MTDRMELEITLNKLAFLSFAVDDLRDSYELPTDPEDRADLLLATEDLVQSVYKLAKEIDENQKLKTIVSKKNLKIVKVWVVKMDVFLKTLKHRLHWTHFLFPLFLYQGIRLDNFL
jgi:hypothetical protein